MDWLDLAQARDQWGGGEPCEPGKELLGSTNCLEILELLCDWWLLKKDSAPWNQLSFISNSL
jgi:hypothetical protein